MRRTLAAGANGGESSRNGLCVLVTGAEGGLT